MAKPLDADTLSHRIAMALHKRGVKCDRHTGGSEGNCYINVWHGDGARYPAATVVVNVNDRFNDIAWGARYEHTLPTTTKPDDVAEAVIATLPTETA